MGLAAAATMTQTWISGGKLMYKWMCPFGTHLPPMILMISFCFALNIVLTAYSSPNITSFISKNVIMKVYQNKGFNQQGLSEMAMFLATFMGWQFLMERYEK